MKRDYPGLRNRMETGMRVGLLQVWRWLCLCRASFVVNAEGKRLSNKNAVVAAAARSAVPCSARVRALLLQIGLGDAELFPWKKRVLQK